MLCRQNKFQKTLYKYLLVLKFVKSVSISHFHAQMSLRDQVLDICVNFVSLTKFTLFITRYYYCRSLLNVSFRNPPIENLLAITHRTAARICEQGPHNSGKKN